MLIMHANRFIYFSLLSIWLLSLSGCIGGSSPPSRFYLLEPISGGASPVSNVEARPLIALGPVRIPRYVDRPQIVTAAARNAYHLSEMNRWAESLDDNISRVLAQNLSLLASVDTVLVNASNRARQAQLRVAVTVLEFHVDPQGQAGLTAQWQIARGEDIRLNRQVAYRSPASTTDYQVMVAALNDCLNRMSRELADAVRQTVEKENTAESSHHE
ncbi:MAG: PqiC family protein [Gammaproteobacteria bacterium]